ncbi:MAG: ABC transporter permease [Ruminococcaceae bacterium]|nr:ABC transporter permease [Oscillospiraceae bacterium]
MTLFFHELKQNRLSLLIWSGVIAFMTAICILIYPEMAKQMDEINNMFANMGSFTDAFGMDKVNLGEFIGFFSIECSEMLGLGGGIFAAILGISVLSKEEKHGTAEFLLAHPVSRTSIMTQKLMASVTQILILNLSIVFATAVSVLIIGVDAPIKPLALIFIAYFIMQLEFFAVTFGLSVLLKGANVGIGIGIPLLFYFLNIAANMADKLEFLKYVTPYGYADGADIVAENGIDLTVLILGAVITAVFIIFAYVRYPKKDIA